MELWRRSQKSGSDVEPGALRECCHAGIRVKEDRSVKTRIATVSVELDCLSVSKRDMAGRGGLLLLHASERKPTTFVAVSILGLGRARTDAPREAFSPY